MTIKRGVMSTQAANTWFCLHVGTVAFYIGRASIAWRLELFTPLHRFRWSTPK